MISKKKLSVLLITLFIVGALALEIFFFSKIKRGWTSKKVLEISQSGLPYCEDLKAPPSEEKMKKTFEKVMASGKFESQQGWEGLKVLGEAFNETSRELGCNLNAKPIPPELATLEKKASSATIAEEQQEIYASLLKWNLKTEEHIQVLARNSVLSAIVNNPVCSADLLRRIYNDGERDQGIAQSTIGGIAKHLNTPADILAQLATHRAIVARQSVAQNIHAAPATLELLSGDKVWYIRMDVVKNPSTGRETLIKLTTDPNANVSSEAIKARKDRAN